VDADSVREFVRSNHRAVFATRRKNGRPQLSPVAVGNAAGRVVGFRPRLSEGFRYYGESSWWSNPLFVSGYEFMTPRRQ